MDFIYFKCKKVDNLDYKKVRQEVFLENCSYYGLYKPTRCEKKYVIEMTKLD